MAEAPEAVVARVVGAALSEVGPDASRKTVASWTSFKHIEVITELEKAYGVSFSINEVIVMDSIAGIRDRLRSKGIEV